MVHYIRFVKTARVSSRTSKEVSVTALITITTDLGDAFLLSDAKLTSFLIAADKAGSILCRDEVHWQGGSRELPIFLTADLGPGVSLLRLRISQSVASDCLPPILDAWSAPFEPFTDSRAIALVERQLSMPCFPPLKIWEETGNSIAGHIWDAALGCLLYFEGNASACATMPRLTEVLRRRPRRQVKVLELGAGCGIVGIALGQCYPDCAVQLTDRADSQEILSRNVEQAKPANNSTLQTRILDWDADSDGASAERDLDLIVISDCTYNPDSCPDLVGTVSRMAATSPGVRILVAMKRRHDSEDIFFRLMRDANMQIVDKTTIPLPVSFSEAAVSAAKQSEIELYMYEHCNIVH